MKPSDPEYLQLNPLGQVPVLIDGNSGTMNQADAVLKFASRLHTSALKGEVGQKRMLQETLLMIEKLATNNQ